MIWILPEWLDYLIFGAIGFGIGILYTQWKTDPKKFWKEWFN